MDDMTEPATPATTTNALLPLWVTAGALALAAFFVIATASTIVQSNVGAAFALGAMNAAIAAMAATYLKR